MSSEELLSNLIKNLICRSNEDRMEFADLIEELEKRVGENLNMFIVRKAISSLIRSGCIKRGADYIRARHYIVVSPQCCSAQES